MGGITTNYVPGAVQTTTPTSGGAGGGMDAWFFQEMARRRAAQEAAIAAKAKPAGRLFANHGPDMNQLQRQADERYGRQEDMKHQGEMRKLQLEGARLGLQGQRAETAAMTGQQPLKVTTVGNQTFYSPDQQAMTGAQRKAFLPNESGIVSAGSPVATGSIKSPNIGAQAAEAQNTGLTAPPGGVPTVTGIGGGGGGVAQPTARGDVVAEAGGILTPAASSNTPLRRQLTPLEMATQYDTNSRYASGTQFHDPRNQGRYQGGGGTGRG